MPKDTKVYRCVKKVKAKGEKVNPYAVCQASTKQSYATGKKLKEDKMHWDDPKAVEGPGKHPYATHMHKHTSGKSYELKGYVNGDVRVHDAKTGAHIGTVDQFFGSDWSTPDSMKHGMRIQSKFRREVERHINAHEKSQKQGKIDEGLIKAYKKRQLLKKLNRLKGAVTIGAEDKELRALKMDHLKSTKPDTTGPNAGYGYHNDALNRAIKRVKGLKEEDLNEWPGPTAGELKPLKKVLTDRKTPGRLRVRNLAKQLATPKKRSMETDSRSLLPSGSELRAGWENDKKKLKSLIAKLREEESLSEKNTRQQLKHAVTSHQYEAGATRKRASELRRGPLSKAVNASLGRSKMNVKGEVYDRKLLHKAARHDQAAKVADELRNRMEYPNSKKTKWSKLKENRIENEIKRDELAKGQNREKTKERMKNWEKRWGPIKRPAKKVDEESLAELMEEYNRNKMNRYLATGKTGKIGKNLHVVHDAETNTHTVKLHGHPIIRKYADNSFEVHGQGSVTGGKPSVTTKRHINAWMNANGYRSFGHTKHVFMGPDGKEAKTNDWIRFPPKKHPLSEEGLDEMKTHTWKPSKLKPNTTNPSKPYDHDQNVHTWNPDKTKTDKFKPISKPKKPSGGKPIGGGYKPKPLGLTTRFVTPKPPKPKRSDYIYHEEYQIEEDETMDTTGNLVNALVDKNALDVKDAFNDAMQAVLPDMVEVEKERIANTIIPQEEDDNAVSDEEMEAFFDSLSDEEFEEVMNSITDEEIPDEDYEVDAEESSDDED